MIDLDAIEHSFRVAPNDTLVSNSDVRALIAEVRRLQSSDRWIEQRDERDKLRAENARLREACQELWNQAHVGDGRFVIPNAFAKAVRLARAALGNTIDELDG